jgi:hypothetical protein
MGRLYLLGEKIIIYTTTLVTISMLFWVKEPYLDLFLSVVLCIIIYKKVYMKYLFSCYRNLTAQDLKLSNFN